MAITDNSKLVSAINKQGNSTDPGCGCGAVLVAKTEDLPAGDYVAFQQTNATAAISLTNIVFKGEPIVDISGTPITTFVGSEKTGTTIWYANIESCTNDSAQNTIFYKRCK